jgi:uncharacterized membrane protein YdjX (TVP38/TMEM64 family)
MEQVNPMDSKKFTSNLMNLCTFIGLATSSIFIFYGYKNGLFYSIETFRDFIVSFGIWASLIFILIQIVQVIIPILPGAVGCIAGIVIFGPGMGFLYNYIGICIGSIIVFILSKRYGGKFVKGIVGEKSYDKYIGWVHRGKRFDKMFAYAIFFPLAPDDLLCYIAGLTRMKLKKFVAIILLGKPMSIAIYSMGITAIGQYLISLIK